MYRITKHKSRQLRVRVRVTISISLIENRSLHTDSRISMSATMWHSFLFFSCSVHVLKCSFCAPSSFLKTKTKKNFSYRIVNHHITGTHASRLFCTPCSYLTTKTKKKASHQIVEQPHTNLGMFMVC
jgi:hypothetical protein